MVQGAGIKGAYYDAQVIGHKMSGVSPTGGR